MKENLIIRDGKIEDARFIAQCVMAAVGYQAFDSEIGDDGPGWIHKLIDAFAVVSRREDTLYSYLKTRVAEVDGVPAGCMIAYPGDVYAAERPLTWELLDDGSDYVGRQTDMETFPGEYYLDSLALSPEFRGRGIGRILMEDAIEQGRKRGFTKFTLIADKSHGRVIDYYAGVGFRLGEDMKFFGEDYVRMALVIDILRKNA